VLARPKAFKMLEQTGFVMGAEIQASTADYGVDDVITGRAYRRDPPN
jgi:hypothetical protein